MFFDPPYRKRPLCATFSDLREQFPNNQELEDFLALAETTLGPVPKKWGRKEYWARCYQLLGAAQ